MATRLYALFASLAIRDLTAAVLDGSDIYIHTHNNEHDIELGLRLSPPLSALDEAGQRPMRCIRRVHWCGS